MTRTRSVRFRHPQPEHAGVVQQTGLPASNRAMRVQLLPPAPASVTQLAEFPILDRAVVGSIPTGGTRHTRGVAQPGQRASFGTRRSKVRILLPRPDTARRVPCEHRRSSADRVLPCERRSRRFESCRRYQDTRGCSPIGRGTTFRTSQVWVRVSPAAVTEAQLLRAGAVPHGGL